MKILLDECVPMLVLDYLKNKKYEVVHVRNTPWRGMNNSELYTKAQGAYQVFVTTDRHFAHPERFRPTPTLGVVYLRIAPTVGPLLVSALDKFLAQSDFESVIGKLAIVRREDFTVR